MTYKLGKDGWPTDETVITTRDKEIESLRQQLAEANNQVNQLNNMMRDKGFGQGEIDTMGWYEQQLAECQALKKSISDMGVDAINKLAECQAQQVEDEISHTRWMEISRVSGFQDGKKESLTQLTECQAREKVLRRRCEYFESVSTGFEIERINGLAPLPPSDSTALDTMLKQAKREVLLEVANKAKPYSYRLSSEFERMAKEME